MGCILESRYLQHLLVVTQNEAAVVRLNFWLQQALYEGAWLELELFSPHSVIVSH
jgi:hypothetical protein